MAELLLEILSEEIPARMQARAADDLKRLLCNGIREAGLDLENPTTFVTPRRLVFMADGISERTPDVSEERKGPATSAPEQAINGFLGSVGLTRDQVEKRELPGGEFYFAVIEKPGVAATDVLPDVIETALETLPWARSMNWADHDQRWVRPLHGLVCLFDGAVVPVSFGPVTAGNRTVGHRFLNPGSITITRLADYRKLLFDAWVMVDPAERRAVIVEASKKLAAHEGLFLKEDKRLLDEVTGLVEWPVPIMGRINDQYMALPPEVLTTCMRSHQKYFACLDGDGNLANRFVVVANTRAKDGGERIRGGNERVLNARLADAWFFWDQDRSQTLASRAPALKDRVFHAKLGTLDHKVDRMQALAASLAAHVPDADKDRVRSAARLAKADLSTGMVGEFPDLQGIMGRYYAIHDGESDEAAAAIAEHYSPLGPSDTCPTKPVSVCVALADKIDTLVGFFGIDEKPTGSKDPFALRRAALGIIRLIIENNLRLSLHRAFSEAAKLYGSVAGFSDDTDGLMVFFADRLKVHLREQGVRHDLIDAVFALGGEDDLVRLLARVDALSGFLESDDGSNLMAAYKRAANILHIEEKKDDTTYAADVDEELLSLQEEAGLAAHLRSMLPEIEGRLGSEDFAEAMKQLSAARPLVDAFFDKVIVNADDPAVRVNRLNLLALLRRSVDAVADFSRIEG